VNLYEAKTHLSTLVDEASRGARIIIAKNGEPRAMLVPIPTAKRRRKPAHALRIVHLADDFDEMDPEIAALFEGRD
jgi:prevent-host-death family protein